MAMIVLVRLGGVLATTGLVSVLITDNKHYGYCGSFKLPMLELSS